MPTTFYLLNRRLTDDEWLKLKAIRTLYPDQAWRYGDPHPDNLLNDGTRPNFVFLQYQRESRNGERWVTAEQFEAYRDRKLDRSDPRQHKTPTAPPCDSFFMSKPALHAIPTARARSAHRRRVRRKDQVDVELRARDMLSAHAAATIGGFEAAVASPVNPIMALDAARRKISRGEWWLLKAWLAADPTRKIGDGTCRESDGWVFHGYHPLAKGGERWSPYPLARGHQEK